MRTSQSPLALCPKFTEYSLESRARSGIFGGTNVVGYRDRKSARPIASFLGEEKRYWTCQDLGIHRKIHCQEGSNGGHAPILFKSMPASASPPLLSRRLWSMPAIDPAWRAPKEIERASR